MSFLPLLIINQILLEFLMSDFFFNSIQNQLLLFFLGLFLNILEFPLPTKLDKYTSYTYPTAISQSSRETSVPTMCS
jgi:hypothetical protein